MRSRSLFRALPGLLIVLAALVWALPIRAGDLLLDMLDVGQGDSLLLRSPDGKVILVDAGDGHVDVTAELRARGVDHLDLVVVTHAHDDHLGGMEAVIRAFPVGVFMDSGVPHTSQVYTNLMAAVEALDLPYQAAEQGQHIRFGAEVAVDVLWPGRVKLHGTRSDLNANSVVLRVEHGNDCMLLTGDSEEETEVRMEIRGLEPCGLLKVAHHGSNYSSTDHFLIKVKPGIGLISVGESNRYNHPGVDTLGRLEAHGVAPYRTDLDGALRVISSGHGMRVQKGIVSVALGAVAPPAVEARQVESERLREAAPATPRFVASRNSEVFHAPGCEWAAKIKPANLVTYDSYDDAIADGRRPAGCCHPQPGDHQDSEP
jgi:competence protein ComEC